MMFNKMEGVNQQVVDELAERRRWAIGVKSNAGWVCERCGDGVGDKEILESHHKKSRHIFPRLALELDNGECNCLWRHILQHKDNPAAQNMILLRLVVLLTTRLYGNHKTLCQKELETLCTNSKR